MTTDRDQLRAQIVRHEGLRLKPYLDTVGNLTIGVGRNLDDVGITVAEAEYMLSGDIDRTERGLVARYPMWFSSLDPVRRSVLINMGFNMGLGRLSSFTRMLAAVASGDYAAAANEMLHSKWAGQVRGRATELAEQMRTGTWR